MSDTKALHLIMANAAFLGLACCVAWVAWRHSKRRRAEVEQSARLRAQMQLAMARLDARMSPLHPEKPLPPGEFEALWRGGDYALWDAQMADVDVNDSQGEK